MRHIQKLTTGLIAVSLITTLAGCTGTSDKTTATPTPTASSSLPGPVAATAQQTVATDYETFLNGVYSLDTTKLTAFYNKYGSNANSAEPSEAEKAKVLAELRGILPALNQLDTAGLTNDQIATAYGKILTLGSLAVKTKIVVTVPPASIKVTDNKAVVDTKKIKVTVNGKASSSTADAPTITYAYKNSKWVLEPWSDLTTAG